MMINRVFLLCILLFLPAQLQAKNPIKGIIGQDDRKILELSPQSPYNAVGRINIAGFKNKSLCTGTLIAPNKVITAAHCLFNPRSKKPYPLNIIHFVAGKNGNDFKAHAKALRIDFLPSYNGQSPARLSDFTKDIALVTLEKSLPVKPLPLFRGKPHKFYSHVMYTRDRPHRPSIHKKCEILQNNILLWLTKCDTNFGGSGGPVFLIGKDGPALAAIIVGILPARASIAIPTIKWQNLLKEKDRPTY